MSGKKLLEILAFLLVLSVTAGCVKRPENPAYIFPDNTSESPEQSVDTEPSQDTEAEPSDSPEVTEESTDPEEDLSLDPQSPPGKRCFIWVDSYANMYELANSVENIRRDLRKAADCGFTDVVVEVRSSSGGLFYKSAHGDPVTWLSAYRGNNYIKIERTADFDYLQAFIDTGHELGLRVYAAFQTFSGGFTSSFGSTGPVFEHPELQELVTVMNTASGLKSMMDVKAPDEVNESFIKFLNPVNPATQDYLLAQLEDLVAYASTGLDGIIMDRARFYGYQSDFSDLTRAEFEKYIGEELENWPGDVCPPGWGYDTGKRAVVESIPSPLPKYHCKWLEFRAKVIHDFMEKARKTVKDKAPDLDFGAYVGGWYSSYYPNGVNWASPRYDPSAVYSWATEKYKDYGYADLMDVLIIGAYAQAWAVWGSTEWTMEGFCTLAKEKVMGDAGLLAGGPDVGNWDPDGVVPFHDECSDITTSVTVCGNIMDAYFLFDMCHLRNSNQWEYAAKGIEQLNNINNP